MELQLVSSQSWAGNKKYFKPSIKQICNLFYCGSQMSADFVVYITFELGLQPVPLQTITNENPAGPSLGTIPQARFLLVMLNMLTLQHGANTLSLLLNSGMLALTQTTLRLIGTVLVLLGRKLSLYKFPVFFTCWCTQITELLCCLTIVLSAILAWYKKHICKHGWEGG